MTVTCDTCEQDIDCRIGYSNRRLQPLAFSCPHCDSQIGITLDTSNAPSSKFSFDGCKPADAQPSGAFDGRNPFIDLHLDFPVRSGGYQIGHTPFMMAMEDITVASGGNSKKAHSMLQFLNVHLNALNEMTEKAGEIKRLINLYNGKNKQLFQQRAASFLGKQEEKSLLPQDINATLYSVVSIAFFPFTVFAHSKEISEKMPQLMGSIDREKLGEFIDHLDASGFLSTLQRDCLSIYPRIYDAELPLRPALFLDLTGNTEAEKTATRVSVQDFSRIKDLYKDIVEILSRQLVLVAGFNNLLIRGDANSFKLIDGGALSDLKKFSGKPLSEKFKYLDDSWYNIDPDAFNLGLRNAIAHNNIHYNGSSQIITYSPSGGRLEASSNETMTFLVFVRLLLIAFREMHSLHHVIKSVFFYKYLIHEKSKEK
ncbi:hypothetical protein H8792_001510 [Thiomicrorhabdus sp. HH1]|uniref:Uncharacterized protein n=2 Tax=Thiomicrorhabdus heinhorstiae TaxID=2748010 RepID=A0ABS0BVC1_9GAMM|nr:hypothetical protein [Thiomicrorhabdus heinhorstiae]